MRGAFHILIWELPSCVRGDSLLTGMNIYILCISHRIASICHRNGDFKATKIFMRVEIGSRVEQSQEIRQPFKCQKGLF